MLGKKLLDEADASFTRTSDPNLLDYGSDPLHTTDSTTLKTACADDLT